MNETPISFNLPSQIIVKECEKWIISILTIGHKHTNFTVTLACLTDSTKLPSLIIFKLVNVLRKQFLDGIYVYANPSEWMDKKEMI